MTDQDKIPRFADGEPVRLQAPRRRSTLRSLFWIAFAWTLALAVLAGMIYLMFSLVSERRAHADEAAAQIFEVNGECAIDTNLRVSGDKRAACVDRLELSARLARAEMRVNSQMGKRR